MSYLAEGTGYVHIFDLDGAIAALKKAKLFASHDDEDENVLRFDHWCWDGGNGCTLEYVGGNCRDAMEALKVIAPFVHPGCYVQMTSESENTWRWVFDGKTVREILPQWPKVRLYKRRRK